MFTPSNQHSLKGRLNLRCTAGLGLLKYRSLALHGVFQWLRSCLMIYYHSPFKRSTVARNIPPFRSRATVGLLGHFYVLFLLGFELHKTNHMQVIRGRRTDARVRVCGAQASDAWVMGCMVCCSNYSPVALVFTSIGHFSLGIDLCGWRQAPMYVSLNTLPPLLTAGSATP
jgi:hypothetical protein